MAHVNRGYTKELTQGVQKTQGVRVNNLSALKKSLDDREMVLSASEAANLERREELERDIEAYERVVKLMEFGKNSELVASSLVPSEDRKVGTIKRAVLDAITGLALIQDTFSTRDIVDILRGLPDGKKPTFDVDKNRSNVSGYLRELQESKHITVVEEGSGRKPAIYRLITRNVDEILP